MQHDRDILETIVRRRRQDIVAQGFAPGCSVPFARQRPVTPFLPERGVILEVKRASPSKGAIAPGLNAAETAATYISSGAAAISVLTEQNFFAGSLRDLQDVCKTVDTFAAQHGTRPPAVLRKDFLLEKEDIEVSWKCGADAVLLIARILDAEKLDVLEQYCESLGLTALIEVRDDEDCKKLACLSGNRYVAGVNARDLRTFTIDPLVPLMLQNRLPDRVVFESGIRTAEDAAFAGAAGFHGILAGETAVRSPQNTAALVQSFCTARPDAVSAGWKTYAAAVAVPRSRPFIKICGITNAEDAVLAAGADALGFVFAENSPRGVSAEIVRAIRAHLDKTLSPAQKRPLFVGVVTGADTKEAREAAALAAENVLDAVQFHGCGLPDPGDTAWQGIRRYAAVPLDSAGGNSCPELEAMIHRGQPRVLIDAKTAGKAGGTGVMLPYDMIAAARKMLPLWIAGGITPDNVAEIISRFQPELIDISSGVETAPGKKDAKKITAFFNHIEECTQRRNAL